MSSTSGWDLLLFAYELKTGIRANALHLTQLYSLHNLTFCKASSTVPTLMFWISPFHLLTWPRIPICVAHELAQSLKKAYLIMSSCLVWQTKLFIKQHASHVCPPPRQVAFSVLNKTMGHYKSMKKLFWGHSAKSLLQFYD